MSTSTISTAVTTQQEHGQQQDTVAEDKGNSLSRSTDAGTETMPNTSAGETLTRPLQDQDQKHQQLVLVPVHATMESYMPVQQQQQQQQQPQMQWYPPSQAFAATAVAHHPQMQMVPSQPYMYGMMQQKICKCYLQPHGCKAEEGLAAGNTCGFLHELPREWRCNNCMNTGHRIKDCHVKYCRFFQQGRCSYQQKHGRPCPMIHEMLQQVPYQAQQHHMGPAVTNGIQAPIQQQQTSPEYAPSNPQVHSAVQHAIPMAQQQQLHTGTLAIAPIPTIIATVEANANTSVTVAPFTLTPTTVATVGAAISNAAATSAQVSDDVSKTSLASIRREYVKEWRQKRQQHFMESASDVKLDKDGDETTTTTMPPCEAAIDTLSTLATATRDNIPPTSPTTGALIANGKSAFSSVISRPNGSLAMTKTMTNGHVHGTSTNGLSMSRVEESRETVLQSSVAKQNQDIIKPVQTPDPGVKPVQVSQDKDVKYIKHAEHVEHAKDTLDTLVLLDNTVYASIGKLSNLTIDTGSWTMKTITVKVPSKYTHLTILPASTSSSTMLAPLAVGVSQSPSPSPMMASDERKQVNGKIMATAATHQVMTTQMTPLSPTFKSNPALLQRSSSANETGKDIHSGLQLTTVGLVSASRTVTPVIELDSTSWQHEPIVHVTSRHADSVISIQTNGQDKKTAASDGANTRAEHSREADGGDKDEEEEETSETEEEEESEHEEEVDVEETEERDNGQDADYDKEWQDIQKDRQKALFPPVVASLAPSKHPLHKTVVCRYFARGNCEKSDSECSFIHGAAGKNERKSAVVDKQHSYKTSIVVVNKAVQQQQQRDKSVVKTSTTVVDKKTAPVTDKSSPLATEADYQCKFWCNVCEVGFHTIVQHNKHDSSEMHKYFTDLKRLNEYTSRVSLAYACFNCGKTDHILKKCPVGFCRRNGNGDCTYGDDCALLHVSYD